MGWRSPACLTLANGPAEHHASRNMLKAKAKEASYRITVGEDQAYDTLTMWPTCAPSMLRRM